jgi:endonuclease/exonuclease/phosphatase family metal-dependent hydrolase
MRRIAWLAAGGMAGLGAARLAGADRVRAVEAPVAPLVSFAPQVTASALLGSLLLWKRHRGAAAAAALTGTVLATVVLPRAIGRRQPPADGPVVKVITANLEHGRVSAGALVRLVRFKRPDVLFLQELTEPAVGRLKQAGLTDLLPHELIDLRTHTARGSGIYSQFPLGDGGLSFPATFAAQPAARIKLPGGQRVDLACIHTHPPNPPRSANVARWREELGLLPPPAAAPDEPPRVLAGDFNATLDHEAFRQVLRLGHVDAAVQAGRGLVPTWGLWSGAPALLTIDHVLLDPRCAVLAVSVHPVPGTDHRAVYAEFRLPAGEPPR